MKMSLKNSHIRKRCTGASLVEYVLILFLVVVAAIGTLKVLRASIQTKYTETAAKITEAN